MPWPLDAHLGSSRSQSLGKREVLLSVLDAVELPDAPTLLPVKGFPVGCSLSVVVEGLPFCGLLDSGQARSLLLGLVTPVNNIPFLLGNLG